MIFEGIAQTKASESIILECIKEALRAVDSKNLNMQNRSLVLLNCIWDRETQQNIYDCLHAKTKFSVAIINQKPKV
ncbi:hypothetical protein FGO68_gene967 [Halteria grandinella]|uniref:Uncharacterized protein n=1 Tax=Halteria grandinella TaxID=5974 RepID=A0A8J8NU74_HALGN|nr:hypothetical protein FGO68_gene967 [Halteria grandinella]